MFAPPPLARRPPADDSIRVEPRSDPAENAALKRRIEQQVRTGLGPQLRGLDVRVSGRSVTIDARVLRFWQKRPVRHYIETLPILNGYQARIDVTD